MGAAATVLAGAAEAPSGTYDADVVILALDRCPDTEAAIRSALSQVNVTRHVWIVDQGSAPESRQRLAGLIRSRSDATLIGLDRNLGVAAGRNLGNALGHGRVIATLDNDAVFDDGTTLARAVTAFDDDARLAAIGFRILRRDGTADDSWGYPLALLARAAERFQAATFVGAGHALRRAAWEDANGYDPALFFCWEKFDFCLRAIDRGWRIKYRGDLVVRHGVALERRVSWSGTRWFYFVRNRLYIARKWGARPATLIPRFIGYLARGLRNGLLWQTLHAWPAAAWLASDSPPRRMSKAGRAYLRGTDAVAYGSLLRRLRDEVFSRLVAPLPAAGRPPSSQATRPYAPPVAHRPRAG
jgi:GT2 family glycosyltransferase